MPSTKLEVGLVAGVVQNDVDFAYNPGTVPRQAVSNWVASRFVNASWEKEEVNQASDVVLWWRGWEQPAKWVSYATPNKSLKPNAYSGDY